MIGILKTTTVQTHKCQMRKEQNLGQHKCRVLDLMLPLVLASPAPNMINLMQL